MSFKLRMLFDGLCVFVPNTDESKGMRVLVIDGRAPGLASNGESQVSHIPSLRFALADLAASERQPTYRIDYSSADPIPRGAWLLNGDDLEIRIDGVPLPDGSLTILRSQPLRDFSLVPSMRIIYPETLGIEVREECLDRNLKRLADAGLAARMRLQNGVVGAWDGADGRYISSDEFMFIGTPGLHRQRIAGCVFFETEVEGETVEIFSRQRGHGPVFRPQDDQTLEISLRNDPPEELMGARPTSPDADFDFEMVYKVAQTPPPQLRVPVRATAAWPDYNVNAEAGLESRKCMGASYNPNQEAGGEPARCTGVAYNPSSETPAGHKACAPAAYNPSHEAGTDTARCTGAEFNPSEEASGLSRPMCTGAEFNPSSEAAGSNRPICSGALYNPSDEAGGSDRPICTGATYNPSSEASGFNGPICSGVSYNPSDEAGGVNRQICTGVIYNPSHEAAGTYSHPICVGVNYNPSPNA